MADLCWYSLVLFAVFFFFSSRRRHTRCSRDWSSDVCSSDLRSIRSASRDCRGIVGGRGLVAPHPVATARTAARRRRRGAARRSRGSGCTVGGGRRAEGGRRARRAAGAARAGARDPRRARSAQHGGVSGGRRASAAGRAAPRPAGAAARPRSGGVCDRARRRGRAARCASARPRARVRERRAAMTFSRPLLLVLLLALPLWWWWRRQRLSRLAGAPMSDVRPPLGPAERVWVARPPGSLRSLCLAAWIIAAAGPRLGSARAELRSEGISIVIALDLSSSMLAEDFSPNNRLDVARRTAMEFVRARSSDRIGLVAFAGQALTQVPITTDYEVLEEAIRQTRVGILEDGTAIGTAIATSANRLRRAPGKSKVVVLLTDGVNNKGTVDPRTAAHAAAAFGIKIYTVGVGRQGEAPVPTGRGPL